MRYQSKWIVILLLSFALTVNSCSPSTPAATLPPESTQTSTATPTQQPTSTSTFTPTPQSTSTPVSYGPDQANFPANINPLTGQPVADPSLLKIPAMLVSISNFPATALSASRTFIRALRL